MHRKPSRVSFRSPWRGCAFAAALALAAPAFAHEHEPAATQPADASEDLGRITFPTSTRVPAAQAAFERGMLWLHLFEYRYAADAFRKAQQLDPGFALAYWGEAMTYTHAIWNQDDAAAARAALARLGPTPQARAAKAPTEREKAFLDTGEQEFGPGTLAERDARFLAATQALARRYPDDDEAQILYALALLGVSRGERNLDHYLQAAAISRRVLAHNPRHPGAAHFWIHGMDDPQHAQGALEAAAALSKIAPGAGHAQHMVSHIYIALGMWDEVIAANEQAMRVVAAQAKREGKTEPGCFHYDEWLQYAYYQVGRMHDGQRLLAECVALGPKRLGQMLVEPGGSAKELAAFQRNLHGSLVRMRATAVVESASDAAFDATLSVDTSDLGTDDARDAFARGHAAASAGDSTVATAQAAALDALVAAAGARAAAEPQADDEKKHELERASILSDLLHATVDAREGRAEQGLARARSAAKRYEAMPFDFGPPVVFKPPRELAGEILLQLHRPKDALAEFDLALKMAPRRALSMLGRARAFAAMGDAAAARKAYTELAAMWVHADPDLPARAEVGAGQAQ